MSRPTRRAVARHPARRSARSPAETIVAVVTRVAAVGVLAWLGGFAWFALTQPVAVPLAVTTDAVVVLTGGAGRLARGVAALEAGSAQRMLVSGVNRRIDKAELAALAHAPLKLFTTRADLGYAAVDTRSNAIETTAWVTRRGVRSLRLVTSAAHMRRARLELSAQLPGDVIIVEDAVPAEAGADSIAREYSKFVLRFAARAAGAA